MRSVYLLVIIALLFCSQLITPSFGLQFKIYNESSCTYINPRFLPNIVNLPEVDVSGTKFPMAMLVNQTRYNLTVSCSSASASINAMSETRNGYSLDTMAGQTLSQYHYQLTVSLTSLLLDWFLTFLFVFVFVFSVWSFNWCPNEKWVSTANSICIRLD